MKFNLLLIGAGKWGKNYINTLEQFPNVKLTIADRNNWKRLIDEKPDGVIVCTPPQSHVEIASYALEKNISTMIEKPLALSLKDAEKLKIYSAPILVNHIHLFANEYQKLKENFCHQYRDIHSIYSCINIGAKVEGNNPPRDYSDLWDYGPHDIAMILDLLNEYPQEIKYIVWGGGNPRDFFIKMTFQNNIISRIFILQNVSKSRSFKVEVQKKVKNNTFQESLIYDDVGRDRPLTNALNIFINAIQGKLDPYDRLGLKLSLDVIKVLEECEKQLLNQYINE